MIKPRPVLFKWRHFEPEVIVCAVRWYLRFSLSYRDVEELLVERGLPCGPYHHLELGAALLTRTEQEMSARIETNQRLLEGRRNVQRAIQEGSSPSGVRMRSAVSKGAGNSSSAGKRGKVWKSLNGHEDESRTQPRRTCSHRSAIPGGQGVRREVESEGHEEKCRAVIEGAPPRR
jgi:hypothetical protein